MNASQGSRMPNLAEIDSLRRDLLRLAAARHAASAPPTDTAGAEHAGPDPATPGEASTIDPERLAALAEDLLDRFDAEVREHPKAALAAAFGLGLALGLSLRH
jgi:hypothetical protein